MTKEAADKVNGPARNIAFTCLWAWNTLQLHLVIFFSNKGCDVVPGPNHFRKEVTEKEQTQRVLAYM